MDLAIRWHRLLRAIVGIVCFAFGLGMAVFIFSNLAPTEIHWRIPANVGYSYDLTFRGVSLWVLAIVPLVVGAIAGYFYQTPARMHHVREALHHRHRVHELEHELKEVRKSLDKMLMMPEDGSLALPAALLELREAVPEPEAEAERDPRLPDEEPAVALITALPRARPARVIRATRAPSPGPRKGLLGGLKAEIAEIQAPVAIPATVVARPRRNGRTANGKAVAGSSVTAAAVAAKAKPSVRPARGRRRESRKPA
jgi:hypothetical protein